MPVSFKVRLLTDPRSVTGEETRVLAKSLTKIFRVGADALRAKGKSAIAAGGFGSKWTSNWIVRGPRRDTLSPRIFAYHKFGFAGVFEEGESIGGKPLLWLPIEANLPPGVRTPKQFPGPLRGGRRGGKPLLFGQVAVGRGGAPLKRKPREGARVHKVWKPVFVGVKAVYDPKKFDLEALAEDVAKDIASAADRVIS